MVITSIASSSAWKPPYDVSDHKSGSLVTWFSSVQWLLNLTQKLLISHNYCVQGTPSIDLIGPVVAIASHPILSYALCGSMD